jgi:hypothetical protein
MNRMRSSMITHLNIMSMEKIEPFNNQIPFLVYIKNL